MLQVSIQPTHQLSGYLDALHQTAEWAGLKSIIRVTSYRHRLRNGYILIRKPTTRYYISSVDESVEAFGQRIRNY